MIQQLTNGFIDKDLPSDHQGSFGRFDKGRVAQFEIGSDRKKVIFEFFVSFLDSVANAENVKIDENILFKKAQNVVKKYTEKLDQINEPKLLFLYNFSTEEFLVI